MPIFPIRTDRRQEHTPWVNYALIAANVVVFLLTRQAVTIPGDPIRRYMLNPDHADLLQFLSYQFLHQNAMHILGNMIFLYVFGNGVEDRLGKVGYLAFYLAGGVIAGLGHCVSSSAPVLGASGAVSAVTGAYLVLAPMSNVTLVYWFITFGDFEVSSLVLILFQIGENVFFQFAGGSNVAYTAHLAGYTFGILVAAVLLLARVLSRNPFDLLALIEHRRRRAAFHVQTRRGWRPWEATKPGAPPPAGATAPALDPDQQRLADVRARIHAALTEHRLGEAADLYAQLLSLDPGQVLGLQPQLDIANQLMKDGRYELAARAYELFLTTFRTYEQREQVELILGLIYARYLDRRQRARELLTSALARLTEPAQKDLAHQTLAEIA